MATAKKTVTGRWQIQIEVAGVRDSGTFDTKREADAWAARRATELRAGKAGQLGSVKTLRDALRRYAQEVSPTKKGEVFELRRLAAFESAAHAPLPVDKRLDEVTSDDLGRWRDARLKVTARGSVLRDMTLLSAVLETARREWRWASTNALRDVRRPQQPDHREVLITGPQIRQMLRAMGWCGKPTRTVSQAVGCAFLVALQTGARAGELCALTWADVAADHFAIRDGKTGKRDVPLVASTRRVIELMRGFDDVLVFGLQAPTLDALFRKYRQRAGLEGFTFHDARHTAATRLAQRLHVLDLCRVFGWANTSRALTYYNPTAADIARRLASSQAGAGR